MSFVPGFQFRERLYESKNSLVLRGVRDSDGLPVVIKILKNDYPTSAELAHYRREFEITQSFDVAGVIRSYELRRHEKTLLIVFEDFGGMSIDKLLKERALSLSEFFDTSIQVALALDRVHHANIIHKDINPSNLVINPSTGEVKIIDFGISTQFSSERPLVQGRGVLQGTLAYMSPEQTGRMNRSLDYRTDLYSLGATFYQMLTRSPPFGADDELELVHCHIAREPVPPHRRNPDISLALSKIISKLMSKKAEDRYQSVAGLNSDLETVRRGGALERFEAGRQDHSDRFQIPERLYGRSDEVERLLEAFERTRRGQAEMMLVTGPSGVGKSALINEIHKPITRARGYFIAGKYDQLQRNVPYSGLTAAFRDLVRQLLTESEERLATWRSNFQEALTPNAGVILDVLPELELVIGRQPLVPELAAAEATNRFNRAIGQFLRALCAGDNLLVLFLDDLQWADSATLKLLSVVLLDEEINRLFLIAAYRDNEVDAMHPLNLALHDIRESGGKVDNLALAPLGLTEIANLLGDTLQSDAAAVTPLARLILQKTEGSPLFVKQFLYALHHRGLIKQLQALPTDRFHWAWDLRAIREADITDNVVDLLLSRLRRLAPDTQEALWLAACIGNRFDVDTLAMIRKLTPAKAFESLRPAIQEGLIRPLSDPAPSNTEDVLSPLLVQEFSFQHDRIQQAAYSLIEEDQRRRVHLAIGRRFLATLRPGTLDDRVFEVVDHLNLGRDFIEDAAEKLTLARLNLQAARKASDSIAYSPALLYVDIARALLGEGGWEESYGETLEAFRRQAELEYLNRNFDRCADIVAATLTHAKTNLEKAEVFSTRIVQHTLLTQFQDAVAAGRNALALVGVELPLENLQQAGLEAMGKAASMLDGRNAESLFDNPDSNNKEMLLAQRSIRHLMIPAFMYNQELFPLLVGTSVRISLEYGNAPESSLSFANYGLMLGAFRGMYKEGLKFGELALRLCDRFHGAAPTATVCLVLGSELMPWVQHVRFAIPIIKRGYEEGLASGDILWAGYLVMYRVLLDAFGGKRLDELLDGMSDQLDFTSRTQNPGATAGILAHQIILSTLAGRTKSSSDFSGGGVDEVTFLHSCEERHIAMAICFYKILKAQALYLFGRPQQAYDATREIDDKLNYIVNHPILADRLLYQSLALASLWGGKDSDERRAAMEQLQVNLAQLKRWSDSCPENYLAKRLMVQAEIARITGDDTAADLYDHAIDAAHEGQFVQDEALANELAGRFVIERRPTSRVATMYLRDARYAYSIWGARRKIEELELEFPQLLTEYRDAHVRSAGSLVGVETIESGSSTLGTGLLDLNTLVKASQTISSEVVLGHLLERLLGILIENAGAQRGLLLLSRAGALYAEAEASVVADEAAVLMSIPIDTTEGASLIPITVAHYTARTKEAVVVDDAQQDPRFLTDPYVQKRGTRSVLCQPIVHQGQMIGLVYLENDLITAAFTPERTRLLALLSGQIAVSIKNAELVEHLEEKVRERTAQLELRTQFIEQTFGRYMSSEIADSLLKSPEGLDFGGQKRIVTILMSDLRGFSSFSETLPPEAIVKMLNNYFSEMTTVIQKHNGTIDEFIGDAILVIFGAPLQRRDDAERAVACAVEMQMTMSSVNSWNAQHGFPALEMGIGINTGEVVAGNIGSRKRAKYSVIGNNVNLAGRIEGYTIGGQVLISKSTRDAVKTPLKILRTITAEPKGVSRPVTIYEVGGLGGEHGLVLPRYELRWSNIKPGLPVTFQLVAGKEVMGTKHDGVLVRVAATKGEIQSRTPPPPFADLKLTLKQTDSTSTTVGIYGKVSGPPSKTGRFVLRFTAVPQDVRQYLDSLGRRQFKQK